MTITPTVGRKVWFHPGQDHSEMNQLSDQPLDATVLFVHDEHSVNLMVIDHMGHGHFVDKAHLVQPDDSLAPGSYANWMPFQVEQMRKEPKL